MSRRLADIRADFERLETLRECREWAWVEEHFRQILEDGSAKPRIAIYESLINQWFSESRKQRKWGTDNGAEILPQWALAIAEKYGVTVAGEV